ncbi:MAG: OsmC family protein [Deltaproteobacteria bacterium]
MSERTAVNSSQETVLNGVNVTKLFDTIEVIKGNAEIARFKFRNSNKWIMGGHNRSHIDSFYGALQENTREEPFVMDNDEPPLLLGEDKGANPVEQVLHGLAGCITTTLVYHAAARGIKIHNVETGFEGDLDLRGLLALPGARRNGYEEIRVSVKVKADATREEIEELVEFATGHSPVFDIVSNPVPVNVTLEV